MNLIDLTWELDVDDTTLLFHIEDMARLFREFSEDLTQTIGDRDAAKTAANRLSVAAFEVRHADEALRAYLGDRWGGVEAEPAELELAPGEQGSLF